MEHFHECEVVQYVWREVAPALPLPASTLDFLHLSTRGNGKHMRGKAVLLYAFWRAHNHLRTVGPKSRDEIARFTSAIIRNEVLRMPALRRSVRWLRFGDHPAIQADLCG